MIKKIPLRELKYVYFVSDSGEVLNRFMQSMKPICKNSQTTHAGVFLCTLSKGKQFFYVDYLVACTFIGRRKLSRFYVSHKDFNLGNNNVDNLEWKRKKEGSVRSLFDYLDDEEFDLYERVLNSFSWNFERRQFNEKALIKLNKAIPFKDRVSRKDFFKELFSIPSKNPSIP